MAGRRAADGTAAATRGSWEAFARCAKAGVPEPRIAVGGNTVSIMFPRLGSTAQETIPATQETVKTTPECRSPTQETTQETKSPPQETGSSAAEKILESLKHNPTLTLAELARQLGMTRDGVKYHVELLKKNVGLRHEGPTKKGRWVLPNAQTDIT